jgi:hypothetical protein
VVKSANLCTKIAKVRDWVLNKPLNFFEKQLGFASSLHSEKVYFLTVSFGAFLASLCCCGGDGGGGHHDHHPIFIHLFHALFFVINLEPAQTESCEETGVVFFSKMGAVF